MALLIPDLIITNTINTFLEALRTDYRNREIDGQIERSMLYLLFNGLSLGQYDLFANVKKIIVTTPENPKHIECKVSFDHNSSKSPAIWVTLPSESEKNNSLSIGEGNNDVLTFDNTLDNEQDEYRKQFSRRFLTSYYIVIICENRNEMLVLYHLMQSMIITCINHFALEGLENLKIGGQDLQMNTVPDRLFKRAITVSFEYEKVVPEFLVKNIYRTLKLFWKPDGANVAQGPIVVTTYDNVPDSNSES